MAKKATNKSDAAPDCEKAPDFEKALAELEALVEQMEQGDITLEDSLKHFERGIALTRNCQDALTSAEQKVQILLKENGKPEPFDASDD